MLRLYKNIRDRRIELGLTQDELAEKLGYSGKSMIAKIESGVVDLPQSKIELFADALQISPMRLMGWGEEEEETISRIRNVLDPNVPKKEEISETDRHIIFCYHLLEDGAKTSVDLILNNAYQEYLEKRKDEENSAS